MPLLEAQGISKVFGKLTALDGAALTVGENEFHGLIGPNGSGKSTLMKCVAGAEVPTTGKVSFVNTDITAFTPTERARAGMSLKFQITSVLPTLTLYDNILLALQAHCSLFDLVLSRTRKKLHDQVMTMLTQFRLADRAHDAAAALSHGQQQWLEIAMALAGKPRLLLLDEPSEGLAPIIVQRIGELLRQLRGTGATVLIAEQNMHFCLGLASHATVIDKGQIVYTSSIEELKANDNIRQRYLAL